MRSPARLTLLALVAGLAAVWVLSGPRTRPFDESGPAADPAGADPTVAQGLERSDRPSDSDTSRAHLAPDLAEPRTAAPVAKLASAFRITASVIPWPPPWNPEETAVAGLAHHDGFEWLPLEELEVPPSGVVEFRVTDPLTDAPLRVSLTGQSLARASKDIEAGQRDEPVEVELRIQEGFTLHLAATDAADNRLSGSWFRLTWGTGQKSFTIEARADESGVATIHDARPGRVVPVAGAPGWGTCRYQALELPRDADRLRNLILNPGGRLEGLCTRSGEPLRDFTITSWILHDATTSVQQTFRDRTDGTFSIEGSYAGWVAVVATLPGGESTPVQSIELSGDSAEVAFVELEFEFETSLPGSGSVVSALDGSPLEGAIVRAYLTDHGSPVWPTGSSVLTGRDGSFEFPAVLQDDTLLSIGAPGRSTAWARGAVGADGSLVFGRTELHPAQTATVILESQSPLPAWTYYASISGSEVEGMHPFPPDGRIELDGLAPGYQEIGFFRMPTALFSLGRRLVPGQEWVFRAPALDSRSLELELLGASTVDEPGDWWAEIEGTTRDGSTFRLLRYFNSDRTCEAAPIPDGDYVIKAHDGQGNPLYSGSFEVGPEDGDIFLSAELAPSRVFVHVTDEDGQPVPDATVVIHTGPGTPSPGQATDAEGRASFVDIPTGPVEVTIMHLELGSESGIVAEVLPDQDTHLELSLPEQRPLTVRAVRGGAPVPDLALELRTSPGNYLVGTRQTDQDGHASFPHCGTGRYYVINPGNDAVWGDWNYVDASAATPPVIDVRRVGTLELVLRGESGEPLANTEFLIYHEQLEYLVLDALAEGRWQSSTDGLRTDASGRVTLRGIPEGAYRVFLPGAAKSWKPTVQADETTFEEFQQGVW